MSHGQNCREITRVVTPGMIKSLHCASPGLSKRLTFLLGGTPAVEQNPPRSCRGQNRDRHRVPESLTAWQEGNLFCELSEFIRALLFILGLLARSQTRGDPKFLPCFGKECCGANTQLWHPRCVGTAVWKHCY